ncbi:hypothetical protein AVEN_168389-1 [Araneus ventricosus]|uniref:Uncharacterized protein n=1 Tax=Araneus ventricosus TaxID=182803 RepID=A0A4Y2QEL6_ARAVE|nr:hypothetical protein AVEN_3680-1 [Araneus ventricosus]GBN62055.1 hypothetical protein AVEN_68199-1 [Araneus ventricosus]GBN62095.1 hypothetical protein AVEN_168389-1 [Araneus ventricosus]
MCHAKHPARLMKSPPWRIICNVLASEFSRLSFVEAVGITKVATHVLTKARAAHVPRHTVRYRLAHLQAASVLMLPVPVWAALCCYMLV